jgi:hypothetical protein
MFLFAGISRLLAIGANHQYLDIGGLILISAGIGVFLGIFLLLKWTNKN